MRKLKYTFAIIAAGIFLGGLALWIHAQSADNDERDKTEAPQKPKSDAVKLDGATQDRIGIQVQPLRSAAVRPELTVYGALEADPSEEFVVKAPFTGILETEGDWPAVGSNIMAGTNVGRVQPLFTPTDQIALRERLASARAEVEAAEASVSSAEKEVSRLKRLNAEDQNISDKAVEEAEVQLASQEARLKSAQASVQLLASPSQPGSTIEEAPLQVRKSGQITEVTAQPGETVQGGEPLLRVSRFDHLLARLYVPPGQIVPASANRATIYPADQDIPVPAYRVAQTASIDLKFQGQTWLFRLAPGKAALRPGEAVTARILLPGQPVAGVLIPSTAILRYEGETWVYLERSNGEFIRRIAPLDHPGKDVWIAKSGFAPGERIVVTGPQSLLSEEMKSQLESGEE